MVPARGGSGGRGRARGCHPGGTTGRAAASRVGRSRRRFGANRNSVYLPPFFEARHRHHHGVDTVESRAPPRSGARWSSRRFRWTKCRRKPVTRTSSTSWCGRRIRTAPGCPGASTSGARFRPPWPAPATDGAGPSTSQALLSTNEGPLADGAGGSVSQAAPALAHQSWRYCRPNLGQFQSMINRGGLGARDLAPRVPGRVDSIPSHVGGGAMLPGSSNDSPRDAAPSPSSTGCADIRGELGLALNARRQTSAVPLGLVALRPQSA